MVLTVGIDVGILHLAATVAEISIGVPVVLSCALIRIGSPKQPMEDLIRTLHAKMTERQAELCPPGLQRVVLEQQQGLKASKNFALCAVLFSYYTQISAQRQEHIEIVVVNPRRKFTILANVQGVPGVSEHSERIKRTKGTQLKALAVEMATALAKHWKCQPFLDKRHSLIKVDDVADSLLYCTLC